MDKRVFLLGAGASKHVFGLPVMSDFIRAGLPRLGQILSSLPWGEAEEIRESLKAIQRGIADISSLFPAPSDVDFRAGNFEQIMTDIELTLDNDLGKGVPFESKRKLEALRRVLLRLISDATELTAISGLQIQEYDKLFGDLTEDDTILTTNYDIGIDMYLEKKYVPGIGEWASRLVAYDSDVLVTEDIQQGGLVKLHGSVNWTACSSPDCVRHRCIDITGLGDFSKSKGHELICATCGASKDVVVLPPIVNKQFRRYPKFGLLWRKALQDIQQTTQLIVFGFSAPETDFHMRWLLRKAASVQTVVVIDPLEASRKRVLDCVLPSDVQDSKGRPFASLQEYVASRPWQTEENA